MIIELLKTIVIFVSFIDKKNMPDNDIKRSLIDKLKEENRFWSYQESSIEDVSDDILIEKTLQYLDLPEISQLFQIFPFKKIKQVWVDFLIPQGEYLYSLNRFLAWYYFDIKKPDVHIKSMATRYFNRHFA